MQRTLTDWEGEFEELLSWEDELLANPEVCERLSAASTKRSRPGASSENAASAATRPRLTRQQLSLAKRVIPASRLSGCQTPLALTSTPTRPSNSSKHACTSRSARSVSESTTTCGTPLSRHLLTKRERGRERQEREGEGDQAATGNQGQPGKRRQA
jgi:hypothetical protein